MEKAAREARPRGFAAQMEKAACEARRGRLPPLIFMTEEERVPDPVAAAQRLPKGTGIILRHRDRRRREALARELAPISRRRGLLLLIAGDPDLAARVGAHGAHFPEAHLGEAAHWRSRQKQWLITAAAHSERALLKATRARADAALLAPVFPTGSHEGAHTLGALRAALISRRAPLPVYALGGVSAANVARLSGTRFCGIAAISALL
jgi:thiamine-phosphate pyrophosphorylase